MRQAYLTTILLMVGAGSASMAQVDAEARLRSRVLSYHSHFEREQYGDMWEMSSKKLRDGNDNDKEEFVRYLRKHRLPKMKTKLLSLRLNGKAAEAEVEISLWVAEENQWLSETHMEAWIFEKGDWYFDTYRVAKEP